MYRRCDLNSGLLIFYDLRWKFIPRNSFDVIEMCDFLVPSMRMCDFSTLFVSYFDSEFSNCLCCDQLNSHFPKEYEILCGDFLRGNILRVRHHIMFSQTILWVQLGAYRMFLWGFGHHKKFRPKILAIPYVFLFY